MFRAAQSLHFHGQTLRDARAEIGLTGVRSCAGKGSKTAPFGVPSPYVAMKTRDPQAWAAGLVHEDLAPGGLRNRGNPG